MHKVSTAAVFGLLACATAFGVQGNTDTTVLIADFNEHLRNRLGGTCNRFQRAPSSASVQLTSRVFRGKDGNSLCIEANRAQTGFCGAWMHLFDDRPDSNRYFDSRPYTHLTFWVKGKTGQEDFTVRMADRMWIAKEDSVALATVTESLTGGITTSWQQVMIPLNLAWSLDRKKLGGLTFEFTTPGRHTIYVDDIGFASIPEAPAPARKRKSDVPVSRPSHPKAMWVWHTPEMVRMDASQRAAFFEFCQQEGIVQLWMQLLYVFETPVDLGPPKPGDAKTKKTRGVVRAQESLRTFIRDAHHAGLEMYGLDGYPEFVQKEYHHCPLAIVDAVIAFNQESDPDERFDGVHFDNEPHLLIGWADWNRRRQILKEFLDLLTECQKRIRVGSDMTFGIDIPFWWQHKDESSGRIHGNATYKGVRKAASYHCIDIVDTVGIMNYRDTAEGPDGMVAHGLDLLAYGDKAKRAKIYMGIETIADMDADVWFAVGLPHHRFSQALKTTAQDFSYLSRVDEFRVRTFDDGTHIHVGLEVPHNLAPDDQNRLEGAMIQIARRFSLTPYDDANKHRLDQIRTALTSALTESIEWQDPTTRDIAAPHSDTTYAGVWAGHVMHPKITFGDDTYDHIRQQTSAAEVSFKRYKSYGGFAIHYYKTYRHIVEQAHNNSRIDKDQGREN